MKPILNNPYGYKICYTKKCFKKQYIDVWHIHSYKRAMKVKSNFVARRKKKHKGTTWHVLPITKREVKKGIWRKPF